MRGAAILLSVAGVVGCAGDDGPALGAVSQAIGLAPVNQLPPQQTTNEDSPLFFSAVGGNALSVSDGDNATLTVQINVTNGTFVLGPTTTGLAVSGNGTFSVTLSGSTGDLVRGLDGAYYRPTADYNGPATLQMNSSDSNGESDLDILAITVTAFNDPPVNMVPTTVEAATEDVPRAFTLSVSDVDVAGAPLVISLTASNATLITLPTIAGLTFSSGDGTADATLTFSGTLPDVNAALNGLVITPPLNYIGASTLVITSNDQGATGTGVGAPGSDNDTITLAWAAVNDPPVNSVPATQSIAEDATLTFSAGAGNLLTVTDVDASTALVQVTLTATNGTASLGNPASVTFTSGDGNADATMTFSGTLSALGSALAGTVYTPNANFAGTGTLTMVSNDLGNSGSGGARMDTDVVTINVSAINDAPVNSVPGSQLTNEDVARVFSTANGNAIAITDADASSVQVTLTATNGTVTLGSRTGLTFQTGDGTSDAIMTFAGTVASINAGLNGTSFAPPANFSGAGSLVVTTSDLGATGAGGILTDTDTIAITIAPVNDPPTAANDVLTVAEDATPTTVAVLANDGIAPDVGESLIVSAVAQPLHGTTSTDGSQVTYQPVANYHGPDSFSYTIGDGSGGTATGVVSVTVTSVNDNPTAAADSYSVISDSLENFLAVLSNDGIEPDVGETLTITAAGPPAHGTVTIVNGGTRVNYIPTGGYSGADAFNYTISDGRGGTATATVTITVVLVITQPVNSLPVPQTIIEDSPLTFSSGAGNAITVSDANNTDMTVQVLVTNGTFTLNPSVTGLAVAGNGTSTVQATGAVTLLNSALNGARYSPAQDFHGAASLTINSSAGGESDLDRLTLAVTSSNDPPVISFPLGAQPATEDSPRAFSNISISDVDLSGAELLVSLTVDNGTTVSLAATGGLTFSAGDGTGDTTMSFAGTLASVNVALNGLTITPPANYIGPSTLRLTSNDQGSTGAGLAGSDSETVSLSWSSVNDPPINAVPGSQTASEDGTFVFTSTAGTALTVSDLDVAAATMQVTLTATNGTMTLGTPSSVTFTAGDGTSDVTMTFRATLTQVNQALEGTSFRPNPNFAGTGTVTMLSNDLGNTGGTAQTDTDVITVGIAPINDAPVIAVPSPLTTNEDVTRILSVGQGNAVTVTDVDATAVQVTLTGSAATLTLASITGLTFQAGDGSNDSTMTFIGTPTAATAAMNGMSFIPTPQYIGTGSLQIYVSDLGATGAGGPLTDQDQVMVTIVSVNDPPDAVADTATTSEDAPAITINVLGNDTTLPDVGESLTITALGAPLRGTAVLVSNGTLVNYTPTANYHGPDSFTYTVTDGVGGIDTATVSVTVTSVNDLPTAVDDTFTVGENALNAPLAVRANDTAAPDTGEVLTVTAVTTPTHGTATITGAGATTAVSYTPAAGYNGPDSFRYTLSDGNGGTATATVSITVTSTDTQPVAVNDTLTVMEDVSGTVAVVTNDTGRGDAPLTVAITTPPAHGTTVVLPDLRVTYTPAANYFGPDPFSYTLTDADGDFAIGMVTVTVTSVDDVVVAVADMLTVVEDEVAALPVLANDTGLGDGGLTVTIVTATTHGTLAVALDGTITYTPAAGYFGPDTLTYRVRDADGDQAMALATLTVTPVNDPPRPVSDLLSTRTGEARTIDVRTNDVDPDGDTLTVTAVTVPLHGTAAIGGDGLVTYTPMTGYTGADEFSYTVSDGNGGTASAIVMVGVGLDRDGDGLLDVDELLVHLTDPDQRDTDQDLIDDGVEIRVTLTNPLDDDGDDDGLLDGHEDTSKNGALDTGETSPTIADTDQDGLGDGLERGRATPEGTDTVAAMFVADADPTTTTDPRLVDTDGGGKDDGAEDRNGNGRVDGIEGDPNDPSDDVAAPPPDDGGGCHVAASPAGASWLLAALGIIGLVRRRRRAR